MVIAFGVTPIEIVRAEAANGAELELTAEITEIRFPQARQGPTPAPYEHRISNNPDVVFARVT